MNSSDGSSELTASFESSVRDTQDEDDTTIVGEMLNAKIQIPPAGCMGSNCDSSSSSEDETDGKPPKRKK